MTRSGQEKASSTSVPDAASTRVHGLTRNRATALFLRRSRNGHADFQRPAVPPDPPRSGNLSSSLLLAATPAYRDPPGSRAESKNAYFYLPAPIRVTPE